MLYVKHGKRFRGIEQHFCIVSRQKSLMRGCVKRVLENAAKKNMFQICDQNEPNYTKISDCSLQFSDLITF